MIFDLIIDLFFYGALIAAAVPVLLGLYGVFLVLQILIGSAVSGVWCVCRGSRYLIIHHILRR